MFYVSAGFIVLAAIASSAFLLIGVK